MRVRRWMGMLGLFLLVALGGACGTDATSTAPPAGRQGTGSTVPRATDSPAPPDLDGRSFISVSVTEKGAPRPLVPNSHVGVSFRAGRINLSAGCNSMGGRFSFDGAVLRVHDLESTLMGCQRDLQDQDTWLASIVQAGPTVVLDADHLVVTAGDTVIELVDMKVVDPDRPLVGTVWTLESIISGLTASSGPVSAERPTLTLDPDGTVRFRDVCQRGSGRYTIDNDVVTFASVVPDPDPNPSCAPDDAAVDAAIRRLLDGPAGFKIDGPRLRLTQGDHGIEWRAS